MAVFFQVFVSKARVATIVGYLLSVWISVMALTVNMVVYPDPYEVPFYIYMWTPLAFSRSIYLLSMSCSTNGCINEL